MRVIGIETSAALGSVALVEDGRVVGEYAIDGGKGGHSRWLLPALEALLAAVGWDSSSIDAVAVNRGPGSFTGVRIGIGIAQGLAFGWQKPLVGVDGLEALAWQAVAAGNDRRAGEAVVLSMIDARHGNVYAAAYAWTAGERVAATLPRVLVPPAAWAVDAFLGAVRDALGRLPDHRFPDHESDARSNLPVLAGDGGLLWESKVREVLGGVRSVPLDGDRLRAATVARWAVARFDGAGSPERVWPVYLKKSEAERTWARSIEESSCGACK